MWTDYIFTLIKLGAQRIIMVSSQNIWYPLFRPDGLSRYGVKEILYSIPEII